MTGSSSSHSVAGVVYDAVTGEGVWIEISAELPVQLSALTGTVGGHTTTLASHTTELASHESRIAALEAEVKRLRKKAKKTEKE